MAQEVDGLLSKCKALSLNPSPNKKQKKQKTVELIDVPRPNSGTRHRVDGPKRQLNFCCTSLNMQSNAELKSLDEDSLITKHIQGNRVPRMLCCTYRVQSHGDDPL
jgi:hypothetical protein